MTILVDQAYEEANKRSAEWAGRLVRERFAAVYGNQGDAVLKALRQRMDQNIQSDGRADDAEPRVAVPE